MSSEGSGGFKTWFTEVWKDPVWSKVIATAILAVIGAAWVTYEGKWRAVAAGLWSWLASCVSWLGTKTAVWNWLLILFGLFALAFMYSLLRQVLASRRKDLTPTDYRTDDFEGMRWYWAYAYDNSIYGLHACCPTCFLQLQPRYEPRDWHRRATFYDCESCSRRVATFQTDHDAVEERIRRFIHQKWRTGAWMKAIEKFGRVASPES